MVSNRKFGLSKITRILLFAAGLTRLLRLAPSFPAIDIVVRALGHAELRAEDGDKALDTLGKSLAVALGLLTNLRY